MSYPRAGTSQVAITPPGSSQVFWLGNQAHVSGLKYSYSYPGGCKAMSCNLIVPARYRAQWMLVNSTIGIYRGGHRVWRGKLNEPSPGAGGWSIAGVGSGALADNYQAVYTDTWPTSEPDELVNNAVGRGLPWDNPGVGQPSGLWTGQPSDSGAVSVSAILATMCTRGGLGWYVNSQPGGTLGDTFSLAPLPTTPTRLLVALNPVARTDSGDVSSIWIRYQNSADDSDSSATYAVTQVVNTGHGGTEAYLDVSDAGTLTTSAAQAIGVQILKIYQNSTFGSSFTVQPGGLLTTGGVPVDLGCEQAGTVDRLLLADFAYGGALLPSAQLPQFITGGYEWDDQALQATITPYQSLDASLSGLLSMTQQTMQSVAAA